MIDFSQLNQDLNIYFLVSGGKDSTAMVLEAYNQGIQGTLLHASTGYTLRKAYRSLKKLQKFTGYDLIKVLPKTKEGKRIPSGKIIREAFLKIPAALKHLEDGIYRKNLFYCCRILKEKPLTDYIQNLKDSNCVLLLGIKGTDGSLHRRLRLGQLRNIGTFYRYQKSRKALYYYPLRDTTKKEINKTLIKFGFKETHSSGCSLCPILCIFPESSAKKDYDSWERSYKFAKDLGIPIPEERMCPDKQGIRLSQCQSLTSIFGDNIEFGDEKPLSEVFE